LLSPFLYFLCFFSVVLGLFAFLGLHFSLALVLPKLFSTSGVHGAAVQHQQGEQTRNTKREK
jgi:hypothetical protein